MTPDQQYGQGFSLLRVEAEINNTSVWVFGYTDYILKGAGRYLGHEREDANRYDGLFYHDVDTGYRTSGGPVVLADNDDNPRNDILFGVHNGGFCKNGPDHRNMGTSLSDPGLWTTISRLIQITPEPAVPR